MSCWSGSASEVSASHSSVISPTTGWSYLRVPRRLTATCVPAHHWRNCSSLIERSPTSSARRGSSGLRGLIFCGARRRDLADAGFVPASSYRWVRWSSSRPRTRASERGLDPSLLEPRVEIRRDGGELRDLLAANEGRDPSQERLSQEEPSLSSELPGCHPEPR